MKFLKGWKTRIAAASLLLLGTLEAIDPNLLSQASESIERVLGLEINLRPFVLIGYGVAIFWLRQVTNTPAGKAE